MHSILTVNNVNVLCIVWSKQYLINLFNAFLFAFSIFKRVSKIDKKKRLLAPSCPSVRMEQLGCHSVDFHGFFFLENL
jgi:hypothetical protein